MEAKLRGQAHKYGKNVDTDVIIPGKYCNLVDQTELGKHALEGLDPDYVTRMKPGDIIVADTNFGCGSSREVAPIAIKGSGTSAVIAKSFARIFYRNALNIGLPIFESSEAVEGIESGRRNRGRARDRHSAQPHRRTRSIKRRSFRRSCARSSTPAAWCPYVEGRLAHGAR